MAKLDTIAVFADCGVTPHQAIYRNAGTAIARHGARLICVARNGQWPQALVDSAFASGGAITVMTGPSVAPLSAPHGVVVKKFASDAEAAAAAVAVAQVIIGLPGDIATVGALYSAWSGASETGSQPPVGLLNRDRAYEVVKGFVGDIASAGRGQVETLIQFSDNFDDLLNRLTRLV